MVRHERRAGAGSRPASGAAREFAGSARSSPRNVASPPPDGRRHRHHRPGKRLTRRGRRRHRCVSRRDISWNAQPRLASGVGDLPDGWWQSYAGGAQGDQRRRLSTDVMTSIRFMAPLLTPGIGAVSYGRARFGRRSTSGGYEITHNVALHFCESLRFKPIISIAYKAQAASNCRRSA